MSREALRDVLKELKGQLRKRRGAEYTKKEIKNETPKENPDPSLADEFIAGGAGDLAKAKAPKLEDKEDAPDFADEIKTFMKKKRVAESSKDAPTKRVVSFEAIMKPKAEAKAKVKEVKAPKPEVAKK